MSGWSGGVRSAAEIFTYPVCPYPRGAGGYCNMYLLYHKS